MKEDLPTLIPKRIDRDPPIIRGVTAPELYTVGWIAIGLGIFSALLFGLVARTVFFGMVAALIIFVLALVFGILIMASITRGMPQNYFIHRKLIVMEKFGFGRAPFIHKSTKFRTDD